MTERQARQRLTRSKTPDPRHAAMQGEELAEYRRKAREKLHALTMETRARATNAGRAYTRLEDEMIREAEGILTVIEIAELIGRSYPSVVQRRGKLAALGPDKWPIYSLGVDVDPDAHFGTPAHARKQTLLCPCGAVDGDHDSWCPAKDAE